MEPQTGTTAMATPAGTSPPPAPPVSPPPDPAATSPPTMGAPAAGTHPPAPQGGAAEGTSTPAPDFEAQFRQRYGFGSEYAQHLLAEGYRSLQARQAQPAQAPAAQQQQAQANLFGLPQFDMGLLNFVGRDATGNLVPLPGAPPDAVIRVREYQQKLQDVQQKFWSNPEGFLAPMVEKKAQEIAAKLFQARTQQTAEQQFAQQVVQQNADWLYENDAQGQRQESFNPMSGRMEPVLSPYGRFYHQTVQNLVAAGVANPQVAHQFAVNALQVQLLQAKLGQLQGGQQQQQTNQQLLNEAATRTQQRPAPNNVQPAQQPVTAANLRQVLMDRMSSSGLSSEAIAAQMSRSGAA